MTEITAFVEAAMQGTEEFYQDVTDQADRNQKHPDFKEYSRKSTADYTRDRDVVERLYGKYCDAYDAFLDGPSKARATNLEKAHAALSIAAAALDAGNAMFTAYLDEGVAAKAGAMFTLLALLIKNQQKQIGELADDIEDIEKLLKKARKEVTEAQVQKGLNLALTAVSLCFPPLRGARAVYVALTIAGTKLAADEFLGPSGPTQASAVKTAVTDYVGIADEVGKVGNTLMTVCSTVDTYTSDEKEVGKARKTVELVKKKLAAAQKAHAAVIDRMANSDRDLMSMAVGLEKAVKAASSARDRHQKHEWHRLDLIDMLEQADAG